MTEIEAEVTENEVEVFDAEDAETEVDTELDAAAIVGGLVAGDRAEDTEETADTVIEDDGEGFQPTAKQIELAKQLGFDDDFVSNMTEAEAKAAEQFGRQQSRYFQRKGKEKREAAGAESSTGDGVTDGVTVDDEFTEDDWFTDEGRKKINAALKLAKTGSQRQQNADKQRLKAEADRAFDSLDKEAFEAFLPGESDLIEPGSPAEVMRNKALQMAETIQATAGSLGHELSLDKAIVQALAVIAPTETENAALNEANAKRKKRGSQRLGTPSTTKGKQQFRYETPEEQAAADTIAELSPG